MKFRRSGSLLLFLAATLFAGAALIYNRGISTESDSSDHASSLIPALDQSMVRSVEISWHGKRIELAFRNDAWVIKNRLDAQANTPEVARLLDALSKIRPLKELRDLDDNALRELSLLDQGDPATGRGEGVVLRVYDASDHPVLELMLGKGHEKHDQERIGNYRMQSFDGRYVKIKCKDGKWRVFLVPQVFERCHPAPPFWLEPLRIPTAHEAIQVRVMALPKDEKELIPVWWAVQGPSGFLLHHPPGAQLSTQKLAALFQYLAKPFSFDLATDDVKEKLRKIATLTAALHTGAVYTVTVWEADTRPYASLDIDWFDGRMARFSGESDDDFNNRREFAKQRTAFEANAFKNRIFELRGDFLKTILTVPDQSGAEGVPPGTFMKVHPDGTPVSPSAPGASSPAQPQAAKHPSEKQPPPQGVVRP